MPKQVRNLQKLGGCIGIGTVLWLIVLCGCLLLLISTDILNTVLRMLAGAR